MKKIIYLTFLVLALPLLAEEKISKPKLLFNTAAGLLFPFQIEEIKKSGVHKEIAFIPENEFNSYASIDAGTIKNIRLLSRSSYQTDPAVKKLFDDYRKLAEGYNLSESSYILDIEADRGRCLMRSGAKSASETIGLFNSVKDLSEGNIVCEIADMSGADLDYFLKTGIATGEGLRVDIFLGSK